MIQITLGENISSFFLTYPFIFFWINSLQNFMECCKSIPELGVHMENGINIDPKTLTMAEFAIAGDMDGKVSISN